MAQPDEFGQISQVTQSFASDDQSNDLMRIHDLLAGISPVALQNYLVAIVSQTADPSKGPLKPSVAEAMRTLFSGAAFESYAAKNPMPIEEEVHCGQCHEDFFPSDNAYGACAIEHYKEDMNRIWKGAYSSKWRYDCCGREFISPYDDEAEDPDEGTIKGDYCYYGFHQDASKMEDTSACEENGCFEDEEPAQ